MFAYFLIFIGALVVAKKFGILQYFLVDNENIEHLIAELEGRIDRLSEKLQKTSQQISRLENRVRSAEKQIESNAKAQFERSLEQEKPTIVDSSEPKPITDILSDFNKRRQDYHQNEVSEKVPPSLLPSAKKPIDISIKPSDLISTGWEEKSFQLPTEMQSDELKEGLPDNLSAEPVVKPPAKTGDDGLFTGFPPAIPLPHEGKPPEKIIDDQVSQSSSNVPSELIGNLSGELPAKLVGDLSKTSSVEPPVDRLDAPLEKTTPLFTDSSTGFSTDSPADSQKNPLVDQLDELTSPPSVPTWNWRNIDFENFLGVKLFAWLGGFAFFLGMAYFVKLSIENDWISLGTRIIIGFLLGVGAIFAGLWLNTKEDYPLTVQSLCAAGTAIFYADFVAARLYGYFGVYSTLFAMVAATVTAFLLAIKLDSPFVAILGLIGGFLTPPILSTGQDNPLGLFSYITLLNCGLVAVVHRKGWGFLIGLCAAGTLLTEFGWLHKFFVIEKILTGAFAFSWFSFFFLFAWAIIRKRYLEEVIPLYSSQFLSLFSNWFTIYLLIGEHSTDWMALVLGLVFLLNFPIFWLTFYERNGAKIFVASQAIIFFQLFYFGQYFLNAQKFTLGFLCFTLFPLFPFFLNRYSKIKSEGDLINLSGYLFPLLSAVFVYQLFGTLLPGESPFYAFSLLFYVDFLISFQSLKENYGGKWYAFSGLVSFFLIWSWVGKGLLVSANSLYFYSLIIALFGFYFGFWFISRKNNDLSSAISSAAKFAPLFCLSFVAFLIRNENFQNNTILVFGMMFLFDLAGALMAHFCKDSGTIHKLTSLISFLLTWYWNANQGPLADRFVTSFVIFLSLPLFHLLSWTFSSRTAEPSSDIAVSARWMPLLALSFVGWMMLSRTSGERPGLIFSLMVLLLLSISWQAWHDKNARNIHIAGAFGIFFLLLLWDLNFGGYGKCWISWSFFFGIPLFYTFFQRFAQKKGISDRQLAFPARIFPLFSMSYVFGLLCQNEFLREPSIPLVLLVLLDLMSAWQTLYDDDARPWNLSANIFSFLILFYWSNYGFLENQLITGLFFFLIFALLHAALPILIQRLRPTAAPYLAGYLFSPLMMILLMLPVLNNTSVSIFLWPAVLLVNIFSLIAAWMMAWLWAGIVMLILTMWTIGLWAFRIKESFEIPWLLGVELFFAIAFQAWGIFCATKSKLSLDSIKNVFMMILGMENRLNIAEIPDENASQTIKKAWDLDPMNLVLLPSMSAFLPFILLISVVIRLQNPDPNLIFGFALLMTCLLLRLVNLLGLDILCPIALISVTFLEFAWNVRHLSQACGFLSFLWYSIFWLVFFGFPFIWIAKFKEKLLPWLVSSLGGIVQFYLLHTAFLICFGNSFVGFLPALMAFPNFHWGLKKFLRANDSEFSNRTTLIALYGGVTLFFITSIFPVQFDKQWLTVGWALEGAALLWLYSKVRHEGLKIVGTALLLISFGRFGLNKEMLYYYPRTDSSIFNWFLYAFSSVSGALIFGGYHLPKESEKIYDIRLKPILYTLGTILLFLLLNIEVANYFSTESVISFHFSGNLAQSMGYSLGWSVFGLALLGVGIRTGKRGAIWGSLSLLVVTITKVFLFDLWELKGPYRVASLMGLAATLILVSFLYQHYMGKKKSPRK
ncbi:MAG: DUF2339 domain-containing protein [Candidatus Riflebacteria bacterium]|nr:DUF2339 domain-containing protein [Candidatus Riflebacteria bacterium]